MASVNIDNSFLIMKGDFSLVRLAGAKRTSLGMTRFSLGGSLGRMGGRTPTVPILPKPLSY